MLWFISVQILYQYFFNDLLPTEKDIEPFIIRLFFIRGSKK
jgi:hypothetical protein